MFVGGEGKHWRALNKLSAVRLSYWYETKSECTFHMSKYIKKDKMVSCRIRDIPFPPEPLLKRIWEVAALLEVVKAWVRSEELMLEHRGFLLSQYVLFYTTEKVVWKEGEY